MTIAEYRAVEIVASTMPAILRALERIADAQERIAEADEAWLALNQLPAASASGTTNNPTNKE